MPHAHGSPLSKSNTTCRTSQASRLALMRKNGAAPFGAVPTPTAAAVKSPDVKNSTANHCLSAWSLAQTQRDGLVLAGVCSVDRVLMRRRRLLVRVTSVFLFPPF